MTTQKTLDRLADGFPHGTPAGFRDGCRGNGACPNRATTRMTCLEASQRYARDLHYRRAYDRGDIILDRDIPVDQDKEKVRAALVRRTHQGIDVDDTADEPTPITDLPPVAAPAKKSSARGKGKPRVEEADRLPKLQEELAAARREIVRLQARLAAPVEPPLGQLEAEDEVLRLTVENGRLRSDVANARRSLDELVELTRRPDTLTEMLRPPGIAFDLINGDLSITIHARMQSTDVDELRDYLGAAS